MRKWFIPLTLLGLGGLGAFLLSEPGRRTVRWVRKTLEDAPGQLQEWNESAQHELDRLEAALDRVAENLERA